MNTIISGEIVENIIKKSKFLSVALNVSSIEECELFLKDYRSRFYDCTHLTYAYIVNNVERCSDDGEPSGTAGKPLLNILQKKKLTNVLLIVIRYFGGIKLGAGGLVRAYTDSGVKAIENVEIVELKERLIISFHIDFQQAFNVYLLSNFGNFKIVNRVGNDFLIECEKDKMEVVITQLKPYNVSEISVKEILK